MREPDIQLLAEKAGYTPAAWSDAWLTAQGEFHPDDLEPVWDLIVQGVKTVGGSPMDWLLAILGIYLG